MMANLRYMQQMDAFAALNIYAQGIATGIATFETETPTWEQFDKKYFPHSRLVAVDNEHVIGWATISRVSERICYNGVAETSIYIDTAYRNKGIGKLLLDNLISESEMNGIWSLLSVMHQENTGSIHLHEKCGFRMIGFRERIAQLHGKWVNTVMMERRSQSIGL